MEGKRRLAIIDHTTHELIIEDVCMEVLEKKYNGYEPHYIDDTYSFDGDYSWYWVTSVVHIDKDGDTKEIDFENGK